MLGSLAGHVRANVVAYVALALALGLGTAWGAGLAKNSVKSKQIKDGQVRSADLADGGVTGTDVDESSLGEVPSAARAGTAARAETAASADHAEAAAGADKLDGRDAADFAPASAEDWHVIGAPGEPPFGTIDRNTSVFWANYDAQHNSAGFYRDPYGVVRLKGLVCAAPACGISIPGDGDPDDIFQLPAGYRPERNMELTTSSEGQFSRLEIKSDGTVSADPPYNYASFYLDGLSFRCGPRGADGCP